MARYSRENRLERRPGGKAYGGAGTNIYRCKDGGYVHFTTNMPHMWKEFAQNWMTSKALAGPEWENPRYRDEHSDEVAQAFAEFIGQFGAHEFATRRKRIILPARRSIPSANLSIVSKTSSASGCRSSIIR